MRARFESTRLKPTKSLAEWHAALSENRPGGVAGPVFRPIGALRSVGDVLPVGDQPVDGHDVDREDGRHQISSHSSLSARSRPAKGASLIFGSPGRVVHSETPPAP